MRLGVMMMILDRANILEHIDDASKDISAFVPTSVRFGSKRSKNNVMIVAQKLILDNADPVAASADFSGKSNAARILTDSFKLAGDTFNKTWSFSEMSAAFDGQLYFLDPYIDDD